MENNELVTAEYSPLTDITRGEVDIQIATAKKWPRDIALFQKKLVDFISTNLDFATSCSYHLERKGKNGITTSIDGKSVRLAELCLSNYGNCRAGSRVMAVTETEVVAQGVFFDIENNIYITTEVRRPIVTRDGNRYGVDMINVTSNAACSIAFRNAVFKGIPDAYTAGAYEASKKVTSKSAGDDTRNRYLTALQKFAAMGVTEAQILLRLGRNTAKQIVPQDVVTLLGIFTAIRDGDSSVPAEFGGEDKSAGKTATRAPKQRELGDA